MYTYHVEAVPVVDAVKVRYEPGRWTARAGDSRIRVTSVKERDYGKDSIEEIVSVALDAMAKYYDALDRYSGTETNAKLRAICVLSGDRGEYYVAIAAEPAEE